jgi:hypothetical protein
MSKPPSRYWPLWSVLLLAATVVIWWLGRPAPRPPAPEAAPAPKKAAAAPTLPAPDDPLATALAVADPRERAVKFGEELQRLLARDPAAAIDALRRVPRGREFTQGLLAALDALARRDPDAALKLAQELAQSREEQAIYSILFDRFARADLASAAARLAAVPPGDARENAVRALAAVWSQTDPAAALAWAQTLANADDRNIAVETTLGDLAARDPRRAIEIARKNLQPPALERTLFNALQRLAATEPEAAAALLPALPPGDMQTMAAANIARALAERSVPAALAWVKVIPVDLTRWMAFNSVLTTWVQQDRTAAARHVLELPPGQGTEFAASHLAQFLASDPADAILWAAALPDDGARLSAQAQIASAWAQRAPAEAVRWAATLNEDPMRPNALGGAFSYWVLQDADAAMAWIESAKIPAATKARLLRRP